MLETGAARPWAAYAESGASVVECSARTGAGIPELDGLLRGKAGAFCGNSGVGKTSLLRRLLGDDSYGRVGEISTATGKGRHTTTGAFLLPRARPAEWHPAFLRTYVEQDIPQLGLRVPAPRILRLLTMLAHAQGSVCNLSELGAAASMSYHSVAHLIDVFEGTFLVRRLQPYFPNVAKRLVKAPKLYIRDTGLLHHLLGIGFTTKAILRHPKAGASFETFCVEQLTGLAKLAEPSAECYFYRTHAGLEVDLILKLAAELIPIEIKLSPASGSARRLAEAMEDLGAKRGYIVNRSGELTTVRKGIRAGSLEAVIATLFPRISRMD